jgi:hypothetical protein
MVRSLVLKEASETERNYTEAENKVFNTSVPRVS